MTLTLTPSQDAVMDVLRRAHPRPLSVAAITWNLDREGDSTQTRTVQHALDALRGKELVRATGHGWAKPTTYGLVTYTCRVCGGNVGNGGTCARCGEAG